MEVEPDGVRLTRAGLFVSDAIWPRLLRPDPAREAAAAAPVFDSPSYEENSAPM